MSFNVNSLEDIENSPYNIANKVCIAGQIIEGPIENEEGFLRFIMRVPRLSGAKTKDLDTITVFKTLAKLTDCKHDIFNVSIHKNALAAQKQLHLIEKGNRIGVLGYLYNKKDNLIVVAKVINDLEQHKSKDINRVYLRGIVNSKSEPDGMYSYTSLLVNNYDSQKNLKSTTNVPCITYGHIKDELDRGVIVKEDSYVIMFGILRNCLKEGKLKTYVSPGRLELIEKNADITTKNLLKDDSNLIAPPPPFEKNGKTSFNMTATSPNEFEQVAAPTIIIKKPEIITKPSITINKNDFYLNLAHIAGHIINDPRETKDKQGNNYLRFSLMEDMHKNIINISVKEDVANAYAKLIKRNSEIGLTGALASSRESIFVNAAALKARTEQSNEQTNAVILRGFIGSEVIDCGKYFHSEMTMLANSCLTKTGINDETIGIPCKAWKNIKKELNKPEIGIGAYTEAIGQLITFTPEESKPITSVSIKKITPLINKN